MVKEWLAEYGGGLISSIIAAVLGFVGLAIKDVLKKIANDKTKKSIAKTCVLAVEQLYKDIHGEEKYNKCVEAMLQMLEEKGITVSELELKMLIEEQVAKLNVVFNEVTE